MATREKGVQTTACPTCGKDLKLVEKQDDGSVAAESCSTCFEPAKEKASKKATAREKGTDTEEDS